VKGRPQVAQSFPGRFCFFTPFTGSCAPSRCLQHHPSVRRRAFGVFAINSWVSSNRVRLPRTQEGELCGPLRAKARRPATPDPAATRPLGIIDATFLPEVEVLLASLRHFPHHAGNSAPNCPLFQDSVFPRHACRR
jgi:hypothetical protein